MQSRLEKGREENRGQGTCEEISQVDSNKAIAEMANDRTLHVWLMIKILLLRESLPLIAARSCGAPWTSRD